MKIQPNKDKKGGVTFKKVTLFPRYTSNRQKYSTTSNLMINLGNAEIIKALLIDFIQQEKVVQDCIFASELFYGSKKRQADLLAINGSITAFEIKSNSDDFRKINEQLKDYRLVFEHNYVVTTIEKKEKALIHMSNSEGLILIDKNGNFELIRKSKINKEINKSEILETIPLKYLRRNFKMSQKKFKNSFSVRTSLEKKSIKIIKETLISYLKLNLKERNELFFSEKGISTHYEDIKFLIRFPEYII